MSKKRNSSPIIENRKARHNYEVIETIECGIALRGNEVKALRVGAGNIGEAWVCFNNGEMVLRNSYIAKWDTSNKFDVSERRDRVLLAHKKEIRTLSSRVKEKGLTLVPLKVYFADNNKAKVLIGLCRGLHTYDIRAKEAKATSKKDIKKYV